MKDITVAIITRLKADAVISGLVSTRVYRAILPTTPIFPAITVSRIDGKRDNTTNTGKYATSRIQCTAWAPTDSGADALSEAIADSLNLVQNTYLAPGINVVDIADAGTVPDNNPDIPLWIYHRDFMINYVY